MEIVSGLLKPLADKSARYRTPMECVMLGVVSHKNKTEKIGLKLNPDYCVEHIVLNTSMLGLPHLRQRVFIICVRRDVAEKVRHIAGRGFVALHALARQFQLAPTPVQDFYCDEFYNIELARKRQRLMEQLSAQGEKKSNVFRRMHKLPQRHEKRSSPFSNTAPERVLRKLSAREADLLNVFVFEVRV